LSYYWGEGSYYWNQGTTFKKRQKIKGQYEVTIAKEEISIGIKKLPLQM